MKSDELFWNFRRGRYKISLCLSQADGLQPPLIGKPLETFCKAMTGILNIRKAIKRDVEFLASASLLANEGRLSGKAGWNTERFIKQARTATQEEVQGSVKNSITYVIEFDGTPIGRLRVVRPDDEIHVAGIQILPIHQQKGIGSSVMRTIMKEADEKARPLTLEVEKDNPDAKRLYLRLGFKVVEDHRDRELMELRVGV